MINKIRVKKNQISNELENRKVPSQYHSGMIYQCEVHENGFYHFSDVLVDNDDQCEEYKQQFLIDAIIEKYEKKTIILSKTNTLNEFFIENKIETEYKLIKVDNDAFYRMIKKDIEVVYDDIKPNRTITFDTLVNVYTLKPFTDGNMQNLFKKEMIVSTLDVNKLSNSLNVIEALMIDMRERLVKELENDFNSNHNVYRSTFLFNRITKMSMELSIDIYKVNNARAII